MTRSQILSAILLGLALILLWLDLFSLPQGPVSQALDSSWCGALIHFSTLKLQFGKDVIFTYGPLAHLISFVYTGELTCVRVIWEYVSKTLFAAILCATIVFLPKPWRLIFFLFVLLFIWVDPISDALYFLVISCVTALLFHHGAVRPSLNVFAGALFGVCSLFKFTYFLLSVIAVLLLVGFYLSCHKRSAPIALAVSFIGSVLLCWKLAGQAYGNFPSYLATSLDISFGYKEAMGLRSENRVVATGIAAAVLSLIQCGLVLRYRPCLPVLCIVLFYAGETFLSWNRAFIRADDHVLGFFALCPVAILTLWVAARPTGTIRRIGDAVNFLIVFICLTGILLQRPDEIRRCISEAASRMVRSYEMATAPGATLKRLDAQLRDAKLKNALPRVRAAVGRQTIDVFGYEQGIALLNDLNYTPRPVFQGYSAYTPRLIAANTAFYLSSRAPAFVLFKYDAIDGRYPTLDDAGVLRELLFNYTPLFEERGYNDERGYTLWQRNDETKPVTPVPFSTQPLLFDEICSVPKNKNIWVELDVPKSFRGRLLGFLYKPPDVEIRVNDTQGRQTRHRLIPSMTSAGFIINPEMETDGNVLQAALGRPESSAVSFLVHVPRELRRFFERRVVCRLAALPELPVGIRDRKARMARYAALFSEDGPSLELTEAFHSTSDVLVNAGPNDLNGFAALQGVELTPSPAGLQIRAEGTDPQVLLPRFTPPKGRTAILRIDLETAIDTGLQLSFVRAGESAPITHFMTRCIKGRTNTIYFELNEAESVGGALQLDPGDYVVTHFEIRSITAPPGPP